MVRIILTTTAAIFCLAMLISAGAHAGGVYRWVDEHGNVHYGDRPPAAASSDQVEIEGGPAPTDIDPERREKARRLLKALESERRQQQQEAERARVDAAKAKQRCEAARERLALYERYGIMYDTDKDGNRVYFTDAQRDAVIADARKLVQRLC